MNLEVWLVGFDLDSIPGIDMLRCYGYQLKLFNEQCRLSVPDGVIPCQVCGLRRKRHVGCDRNIMSFLSAQSVTTPKILVDTKQKTIHQLSINPTQSPRTVHEETIAAWYETGGCRPQQKNDAYCSLPQIRNETSGK